MNRKTEIQAILFDKKIYPLWYAEMWIKYHNFNKLKPVHITKKYYRFRINDPNKYEFMRIKKNKFKIGIHVIFGIL